MPYICSNCSQTHNTGELCPNTQEGMMDKYNRTLIEKLDAMSGEYAPDCQILFQNIKMRLFGKVN